jgi:hypothetical protein
MLGSVISPKQSSKKAIELSKACAGTANENKTTNRPYRVLNTVSSISFLIRQVPSRRLRCGSRLTAWRQFQHAWLISVTAFVSVGVTRYLFYGLGGV